MKKITLSLSALLSPKGYIDPSVMTYTIQAVAGVVIAVGAGIGIYWRKAKKKINKKLGVDENKNKVIEDDEIVVKGDNTNPDETGKDL